MIKIEPKEQMSVLTPTRYGTQHLGEWTHTVTSRHQKRSLIPRTLYETNI